MEQFIEDILINYGSWLYPVILVWTFLEGETVVLITGALAAEGKYNISVWLLVTCAFLGSFAGDQTYFYIGRRYGTPLLKRWPKMTDRIEWAFRLVRNNETLFILSFRFIYGVRNISPFVIGMAGVSRLKFFFLNMIAAFVWANSFAWGGYFAGRALEAALGEYKIYALLGFVLVAFAAAMFSTMRQRRKPMVVEAAVVVEEAVEHALHDHKHKHDSDTSDEDERRKQG